jgi:dimethylhistidine N-methyltransferase
MQLTVPAAAGGAHFGLAASREEILAGLTAPQKRLSPKYFYDERGSRLFDAICELPEYYQTRTELALLDAHGAEVGALVGPGAHVVELGAGSSRKAKLLLERLEEPEQYFPVDISAKYLAQQAADVAAAFPRLAVQPVAADFTRPFALPQNIARARTLVFFPGSTIGNLSRVRAAALLTSIAEHLGGALLIGVDVCRDATVLRPAYNDSRGVTAAFNLNVLARLNRELGADFDLASFAHDAVYDARHGRIEMRLVSRRPQVAAIAGVPIAFRTGEHIVTEHSHKYTREELAAMAHAAGWRVERSWTDPAERFSVHFLRAL